VRDREVEEKKTHDAEKKKVKSHGVGSTEDS
jgi:hypothetical protein